MNIILVALNAKYIHSNLALYSLKAYAAEHGCRAGLLEYTINRSCEEIMADIYR